MQTIVVRSTVCILLSIFFVTAVRATDGGSFSTCILPYLSNITAEIQDIAQLTKDTVTVLNATVQDLQYCFEVASESSKSGDSGAGSGAPISACLTYVSSSIIPQIENLVNEYQRVEPVIIKLETTIKDCLYKPPNDPTPAAMGS